MAPLHLLANHGGHHHRYAEARSLVRLEWHARGIARWHDKYSRTLVEGAQVILRAQYSDGGIGDFISQRLGSVTSHYEIGSRCAMDARPLRAAKVADRVGVGAV